MYQGHVQVPMLAGRPKWPLAAHVHLLDWEVRNLTLLSLVQTTITVDSHAHNEAARGILLSVRARVRSFRRRLRDVKLKVVACCASV